MARLVRIQVVVSCLSQAKPMYADQLGERINAAMFEMGAGRGHFRLESIGHIAQRPDSPPELAMLTGHGGIPSPDTPRSRIEQTHGA